MNARGILQLYRAARDAGHDNRSARRMAESEYARSMTTLQTLKLHAPTPWHVIEWAEHDDTIIRIADRRGHVVAVIPPSGSMAHTNATAARIVECVNALNVVADPRAYVLDSDENRRLLDSATA